MALALVACCAAGCSVGGAGDGGTEDLSGGGDLSMVFYKLVSGTYAVQSVTNYMNTDGCHVYGANLLTYTTTLTNDGSGNVALGPMVGTPMQPSQGSGTIDNNMGTLTRNNTATDATITNCTYTLMRTNMITLTADNTFTANYSETQSGWSSACMLAGEDAGTSCTTTWTWTFTKQ
jgi:hypothetical protein